MKTRMANYQYMIGRQTKLSKIKQMLSGNKIAAIILEAMRIE